MSTYAIPAELYEELGPSHVITDPDVVSGYTTDWTRRFSGPARAVVRPGDTQQVTRVLAACARHGIPVVVQGGNTGLVGGSVPGASAGGDAPPVLLSMTRLAQLGEVDTRSAQVTVGAGATLAQVQARARQHDLEFPVDLAARDTATVGGMAATNAGGVHVLRYGTMRQQVVGLEAVLADGRVISRLSGLVKDNTGYDLGQLLIGSEGTLGVITALRLRLVPRQPERAVLLLGLASTAEAVDVVGRLRALPTGLSAAEVFYDEGMELVCRHGGLRPPWSPPSPVYLLIECSGRVNPLEEMFGALEGGPLRDAATAVAEDPSGMDALWAYRERHTEAVSAEGVPHKLDVTLPISRLADFETEVRRRLSQVEGGLRVILWGHVGDGNLHVNVLGAAPTDESVDRTVLELVADMKGSISAEHGIGRAKASWLPLSRSDSELDAMRAIKAALDPQGLLNPGVLFP